MSSRRSRISIKPNVGRRSTKPAENQVPNTSTEKTDVNNKLPPTINEPQEDNTRLNVLVEAALSTNKTDNLNQVGANVENQTKKPSVYEKDSSNVHREASSVVDTIPSVVQVETRRTIPGPDDNLTSTDATLKPVPLRVRRFSRPRPNLPDTAGRRLRHPSVSASDSEDDAARRKLHHPPPITRITPTHSEMFTHFTPWHNEKFGGPSGKTDSQQNRQHLKSTHSSASQVTRERRISESNEKRTSVPISTDEGQAPQVKKRRKRCESIDKVLDRSKMTMRDLIYWNPTNNPMSQKNTDETIEKVREKEKEKEHENENEKEKEKENQQGDDAVEAEDNDTPMLVPQVRIGPDGNIILNEASLTVEASPEKIGELSADSDIIHEGDGWITSASFKKRTKTQYWTNKETTKFYRAISVVGTDFSMMSKLFPKRSRAELKNKFKKEDKSNRHLIEKALNEPRIFDMSVFESDEEQEEVTVTKQKKRKREARPKLKRKSRVAPLYEESSDSGDNFPREMWDGEEDLLDNSGVKNSVDEVISEVCKPTRSGRVPKQVHFHGVNTEDLMEEDTPATVTASARFQPINRPGIGKGGAKRGRKPKKHAGDKSAPTPDIPLSQNPEGSPGHFLSLNNISGKQVPPGQLVFVTNKSPKEPVNKTGDKQTLIHVYVVSPMGLKEKKGPTTSTQGGSGSQLTQSPGGAAPKTMTFSGKSLLKIIQSPSSASPKTSSSVTRHVIVTKQAPVAEQTTESTK